MRKDRGQMCMCMHTHRLKECGTCCGQSYLVNLVSLVTLHMFIWRRDMERIYVYTAMVDECS